jgi:hypothetical protein
VPQRLQGQQYCIAIGLRRKKSELCQSQGTPIEDLSDAAILHFERLSQAAGTERWEQHDILHSDDFEGKLFYFHRHGCRSLRESLSQPLPANMQELANKLPMRLPSKEPGFSQRHTHITVANAFANGSIQVSDAQSLT